ncbi:MAG: MoaD/ThiS family protein [Caldilineales bacterium]|nr:MoaD/ThiS family protein [Caldilineales bacterium]
MSTVYIPTPLRRLTANQSKVDIAADNVGSALTALDEAYPGIGGRIFDDNGEVKRFINVFVNDDEIRTLQGLNTPVAESDRISIVPAMAGG